MLALRTSEGKVLSHLRKGKLCAACGVIPLVGPI